jgi:hypothetical protein
MEDIIRFKYTLPEALQELVFQTVVDYGNDFVYGILPKAIAGQLRHCSLYMICEYEFINNNHVWANPVAVVGYNEIDAMETYVRTMKKENGSVLCEIVNRCDNLKVEPC